MKPKSGDNLSFNEKYIFRKSYVICNRENQEKFVSKCIFNHF